MSRPSLLVLVSSLVLAADPGFVEQAHIASPLTPELRGFGRVASETVQFRGPTGTATVVIFRCRDGEHARVLAGKYLADLDLSPGTRLEALSIGGATINIRVLVGGQAVLGCVAGGETRVISATNHIILTAFLTERPELARGAVSSAGYPAWLDRFDRYGYGFYGLGGYGTRGGWMDFAKKHGSTLIGADGVKPTPLDDLAFCADNGWRFEPWLDPTQFDDSDGITKNTEAEWLVAKAGERGLGVSFRVYGNAGGADWTARRFADLVEQPFSFLMGGWHGRPPHQSWTSVPHLSWFSLDAQKYMATRTMQQMRQFTSAANVLGWMHPQGELMHNPWYDQHGDTSPAAQADWHAYLAKRHSLAEVSALYNRDSRAFSTWDEVPIPEFATFAGLDGRVLDLGGAWWAKPEPADVGTDAEWWKHADTGWTATLGWTLLTAPGNDALMELLKDRTGAKATCFRRDFDLQASALSSTAPLYLYWFPISDRGLHIGSDPRFHQVWINGQEAGRIGTWGALDISKLLHPGSNHIALRLLGNVWDGRIFLSREAPSVFPYLAGGKNQLWLLWDSWRKDSKHRAWDVILDGMRQVDPDRPIKFMAPISFGDGRWIDLASRWGGFAHFTGEGRWFFPWYKRSSFLYGLPATSEGAGPVNNLTEMFDMYRRIFLAGLNGHDEVFLVQHLTRVPELREFIVNHAAVLHQMGKYDLDGPQVLIHRSTRATTGLVQTPPYPSLGERSREVQNPWDWDLGRGSLQTLGQSYLYLDDGAIADGRMAGYRTMLDCGNEILDPAALAQIGEWVRSGGTYVSFACTGRNSLERADVWQVQGLTGCAVAGLRTPGKGTVTITKDSHLLPGLAGKTYPDLGHCTDWQGGNHVLWDVVLKPAQGAEVIATYEDGGAAVVRVPLGSGQVIMLGSSFWRQSSDQNGLWPANPVESEVLGALLNGVGQAPTCTSSDNQVWAQPYRSNNGLDEVACLVNWHDDRDVTTTLRMRLPQKPAAARLFAVGGEHELSFSWADGIATAEVALPAKEVAVVRFQGVHPADAALTHWWGYQQRIWHALATPSVDFSPYTAGRWADPTIDLRQNVRWTAVAAGDEAWKRAGFEDSAWKSTTLGILTLAGAPAKTPLRVRRVFGLPESWHAAGGSVRLVSGSWSKGDNYLGSVRLSLNGTVLHEAPGASYQDFDVGNLLRPGDNVVSLELAGDGEQTGLLGEMYLYHRAPAQAALDLAGTWTGVGEGGAPLPVAIPGTATVARPTLHLVIPASWAGSRVRLVGEGDRTSLNGAWVNGRLVRRHHHMLHGHLDIDITNHVRFGEDNELVLARYGDWEAGAPAAAKPERFSVQELRLERFAEP